MICNYPGVWDDLTGTSSKDLLFLFEALSSLKVIDEIVWRNERDIILTEIWDGLT
jgi:hypothetical protein